MPSGEVKRKLFHNLSLVYMAIYALLPIWASVILFGVLLFALNSVEFIRLRRPEINAWFLGKFGGIHRPAEVMGRSGIFWTLCGCWLTMLIFTNKKIVLSALGCLALGDTAAALAGKKWGKHPWKWNPEKTQEGSAAFAAISAAWGILFVRWPVAILGAAAGAYVESRPLPYNDNLWVPLLSALAFSIFNLVLGRH